MSRVDPHAVTCQFENAVANYCGAPYCVSTNSCTMALLLAVAWELWGRTGFTPRTDPQAVRPSIEIPKRTYISVPMSIIHAGGRPVFRDEQWIGGYQLKPLPIIDSARWFTSGMYSTRQALDGAGVMMCLSFHASKICGDTQGGAILHDSAEADHWLRKARFDGRTEGFAPKDDTFDVIGWHCYLSPDVAARLLWKLSVLPKQNEPLPNDDYPDLSEMGIFR